jgi:hypothetical protein
MDKKELERKLEEIKRIPEMYDFIWKVSHPINNNRDCYGIINSTYLVDLELNLEEQAVAYIRRTWTKYVRKGSAPSYGTVIGVFRQGNVGVACTRTRLHSSQLSYYDEEAYNKIEFFEINGNEVNIKVGAEGSGGEGGFYLNRKEKEEKEFTFNLE